MSLIVILKIVRFGVNQLTLTSCDLLILNLL